MSLWLIQLLIGEYLAMAVVYAVEAWWCKRPERWPLALYFAAAALISMAVLWMGKRP